MPVSSRSRTMKPPFRLVVSLAPYVGESAVAAGLDVKLYMPQLALATFLSMLPLLAVFLGAQRYLIRGETVGAVKG